MKGKVCVFVFFLVFFSSFVHAFIIDQHYSINEEALVSSEQSAITQEVLQYHDYFQACNLGTDISVVGYFQIDAEPDDGFFSKLVKVFQFKIGKTYRATHSQNACLRAVSVASTAKERVCGYGICSHLVQDSVSHNKGVPAAIKKTHLFNGLVHSIKEIHDKDLAVSSQDRVESRQVLDLLYEMTPYFERVFVEDPAFSKVSIPSLVDFFVRNVQPESEYRLGFRSFFALPSYVYWFVLVLFLFAVVLLGLSVKKFRGGVRDVTLLFTLGFSLVLSLLVGITIYGLFAGNIWSIWEVVSQYVFSSSMYFIAGGMLLIGGYVLYSFFVDKNKGQRVSDVLVALFLLLLSSYFLTLPNSLTIGNEAALNKVAVQETVNLLNNGVSYVRTVQDPVGFEALRVADASGSSVRLVFILLLVGLLVAILLSVFVGKGKLKKG